MNKILLIDHALNTHLALKRIFEEYSIDVFDAMSDREAKKLLSEENSIKLIIIDTNSSNFDGYVFIDELKELYPNISIIVLTSSNSRDSFIKGIKSGVDDYILKPFNKNELVNRVFRQLSYDKAVLGEHFDENNINVNSIIEKEVIKSKKGNYPLIIMGVFFYAITDKNLDDAYKNIASHYFPIIEDVLFDTDIFIQYGNQYFFGILPFCSESNFAIVEEKIRLAIRQNVKNFGSFNIKWAIDTVVFPDEKYDDIEVNKLIDMIKESLKKDIKYKHANIKIDDGEGSEEKESKS